VDALSCGHGSGHREKCRCTEHTVKISTESGEKAVGFSAQQQKPRAAPDVTSDILHPPRCLLAASRDRVVCPAGRPRLLCPCISVGPVGHGVLRLGPASQLFSLQLTVPTFCEGRSLLRLGHPPERNRVRALSFSLFSFLVLKNPLLSAH